MELFISGNDPVVFSVNFYTKLYSIDYTFISNAKRYAKFVDIQHGDSIGSKLILTSNVTACDYMPNYVLNYESLLNKESENPDNALVLLLKALIRIGITEVYLAGFDGFTNTPNDYYDRDYELSSTKDESYNDLLSDDLSKINQSIRLHFITESLYDVR